MQQLTTPARLVEHEALGVSIAATFRRSELEDALADERAQLWFELAREGDDDEPARLTVDLSPEALEEILRLSEGDEVALALDEDRIADLLADPEVEAHGLRGALAIAVTSAAILAPAGLAATSQTAETSATAQRAKAAASVQRASLAANPQVAGLATKAQITPQVSKAAKKAQISAARASGLRLLRSGIVR